MRKIHVATQGAWRPQEREHLPHSSSIVAHLLLASQRWFGPDVYGMIASRNLLFIKFHEADVPVLRLRDQLMMMDGKTMQGLGSEGPRQIPSRTQVRTVSVRVAP
ncbi:MAG: hypothetical protein SGJ26_06390 [Nitrospirota bacterium]|nr:hypothetical protein [Nitrospirota bacterium]